VLLAQLNATEEFVTAITLATFTGLRTAAQPVHKMQKIEYTIVLHTALK